MPRNASSKTTSKTSSRAMPRGAGKSSSPDVLALLKEDHEKVTRMFDHFEKMKEEDPDEEARQMLVELVCAELTVHAQVEEEIFYPALREAIDDIDLLDEAQVEHAIAKRLISELASMQPDDELYAAKFTVLGEYVKHHITEEEKEIFAKAKKAKTIDLMALAEEIQQRKEELRDELGLPSEEEEEEQEPRSPKTSKRKGVH